MALPAGNNACNKNEIACSNEMFVHINRFLKQIRPVCHH